MTATDLISCLMADPRVRRSATYIISPKLVIRVSRRTKYSARNRRNEYVVTIGQPNYLTVQFIKKCKKAGEPFPVKKFLIENYPKKRKTKEKKNG